MHIVRGLQVPPLLPLLIITVRAAAGAGGCTLYVACRFCCFSLLIITVRAAAGAGGCTLYVACRFCCFSLLIITVRAAAGPAHCDLMVTLLRSRLFTAGWLACLYACRRRLLLGQSRTMSVPPSPRQPWSSSPPNRRLVCLCFGQFSR